MCHQKQHRKCYLFGSSINVLGEERQIFWNAFSILRYWLTSGFWISAKFDKSDYTQLPDAVPKTLLILPLWVHSYYNWRGDLSEANVWLYDSNDCRLYQAAFLGLFLPMVHSKHLPLQQFELALLPEFWYGSIKG